jgi:hypothetical protein
MTTNYVDFTEDLLSQIGINEQLTRDINYSHPVCSTNGNHLFYCTMYNGKRYKTSLEQKEQASLLFLENKKKAISKIGNKLVFVGMGCDYDERYEDDVCNHRIRTEITNPFGRKFFIEVGTWGEERMRIDHVIDRDQEEEYSEKCVEIRKTILASGGYNKHGIGSPLMIELEKYQSQPYYWYKKSEWIDLNVKYTKKNVIELVNKLFDCNFSELEIDTIHLTTDDYSSKSPKLDVFQLIES